MHIRIHTSKQKNSPFVLRRRWVTNCSDHAQLQPACGPGNPTTTMVPKTKNFVARVSRKIVILPLLHSNNLAVKIDFASRIQPKPLLLPKRESSTSRTEWKGPRHKLPNVLAMCRVFPTVAKNDWPWPSTMRLPTRDVCILQTPESMLVLTVWRYPSNIWLAPSNHSSH